MSIAESIEKRAAQFADRYKAVHKQLSRVIVGHNDIVHGVLTCLFVGGHCLLEGVPGLGKTLLVRTLAQTLDLDFSRIQFTPDLMPADILGTNMIVEDQAGRREFQFQKGPLFTQICLADEINRATPKTQSALLEAMQERSISIAKQVYKLKEPFFVMATQNPIEQEGTYPLPEAQLDRFMFNVKVEYPSRDEELDIMKLTTTTTKPELGEVLGKDEIMALQETVRRVPIADPVLQYAVRLVRATRLDTDEAPAFVKESLAWGAGPRATQNLILGGKARALLEGRFYVSTDDIRAVAHPVLRHRLIPNYSAEAEGITSDKLVDRLLETIAADGEDGGAHAQVFGS
jgi:MoxR-like ATPase